MMKRIFAALLLLALLLPVCIPYSAKAAETKDLESLIAQQIEEYAASLYSESTPGAGRSVLLRHALFGGGKDLIVDDKSQLTAAFMNSVVLQECLRYSCTEMIQYMQATNLQTMYGYGPANWYNSYCAYSMFAYLNEIPVGQVGQGEYVDDVAYSSKLYGTNQFDTPLNACDEVLKTVVGSAVFNMSVNRVGVGENTAVYQVMITVYDDFDFDADYESDELDTSVDKELAEIGGSLALWLINPFHWESTAVFTLEVPYSCDHSYGDFQWTMDPVNKQLVNDTSKGLAQNPANLVTTGNAEYYRLDKAVQLRHDVPWALEYDISGPAYFSLGTLDTCQTAIPFFNHYHYARALIGRFHQTLIREEPDLEYAFEYHYSGAETDFAYVKGNTYTYRYENRIADDGTNMIWVSVIDKTTQQQVVAPEPMDNTYIIEAAMADQNIKSDWVNGKDISIKYVGIQQKFTIPDGFALRIWTNGDDSIYGSAFKDGYIQPTCTKQGGKAQVCDLCGYYELTEPAEPLGHSFGEYISNGDADCVNDGTKTAQCTLCGAEDTVVDEGSVFGHDFRKYYSDENATCTSDGTKTAQCKYCDVTDTVADPGSMLEHTYEATVTPPTCTEAGYTIFHCTACGENHRSDYVEALGHSWGNWVESLAPTFQEEGEEVRICSTCGATETRPIEKKSFVDVPEKKYYYNAVLWAVEKGVTSGTGNGTTFSPDDPCTRGQVMTFLWRAAGKPEPETTENPFSDLNPSKYYYKAVLWAVEKGITSGYKDGTFQPDRTCSRAEIVTFLYRYAGKPPVSNTGVSYSDVNTSAYYCNPVLWANENSVVFGYSDGTFRPGDTCTRGQIVAFLYRYMGDET